MATRHRENQKLRGWIGLGSNLGDGPLQIRRALELLQQHPLIQLLKCSPNYRTAPWGDTSQPDFINAVASISVETSPLALLGILKDTEQTMGRRRAARRWGPRTMDLDLLLLDDLILHLPGLTVPHPRMHLRAFVLAPLFDLEPDLIIPARGSVRSCLARVAQQEVVKLADENPAPQ